MVNKGSRKIAIVTKYIRVNNGTGFPSLVFKACKNGKKNDNKK